MAQAIPKNPYKVIPIPAGYRRALPKEITPKVQRAAVRALQQCLPIGKLQATEVDGKLYAFITEGHYDDHVTKPGKPIWHPGISTLVPIKQPASVTQKASDALYAQAASIVQPAGRSGLWTGRVTGEDGMSNFEGEGLWGWFKKCFGSAPKTAVVGGESGYNQSDAFGGRMPRKPKKSLAERRAIMAARRAKMGLEEDLESTYAADELYDAVNGEDFGDDCGEDVVFGDDFGKFNFKKAVKKAAKGSLAISTGGLSLAASKKGRKIVKKVAKKAVSKKGLAAIATGGLSIAAQKKNRALSAAVLTGGLSLAAKSQRKAVARRVAPKKAAPRPVARVVARPVARPTAARPTPPRTTATKTDSPLGPSAPFDDTMMQAPASNDGFAPEPMEMEAPEQMEAEAPEQMEEASPEVEAAMDDYESEGGEETPETADEGSDTYDESAINGENFTHAKYSIGA
jgi:hypothetical protein